MPLFEIPKKSRVEGISSDVVNRVNKSNTAPPPILIKSAGGKKGDVMSRINSINTMVTKELGKYAEMYIVIREIEELKNYIDKCIENGICAIDTETSGLDPMRCNLAGISIYTPGMPGAYIPVNHVSYVTGLPVANLIPEELIREQFQRLVDNEVKCIFFNAKFDIRVLKNQLGVWIIPYYDAYIAARLLNENEPANGLKKLHQKYCMEGDGDVFAFDDLFEDFNFQYIPIKTGYIYAARDAHITFELYEFQKPFFDIECEDCIECELERVAEVFWDIEMPLIPVVACLEDTGVYFDFDLTEQLSEKYNAILIEKEKYFHGLCMEYQKEIDSYRRIQGINCKLDNPINIGSPSQIAILLYDILKQQSKDKESPRGTGEAILQGIDHPVCKAVLEYREIAKLISTYVDKMPNEVNPQDGRIHASFNAIGADTGRFSSTRPNLQNIPSRGPGKEVRKMFKATPGYLMISSDYSAQEPRITSHMSNDKRMIQAYIDGKDLYCEIASIAFDVPYDECTEAFGPEGKKRRNTAKAIVLGVCYGKGIASIAEDLHTSKQKASEIYHTIMREFPGLKQFIEDCKEMAYEKGYVDTIWGRKRRLPNIQLQKYVFEYVGSKDKNFDPLADDDEDDDLGPDEELMQYYTQQMDKAWGFVKRAEIKAEALKDGLKIIDNSGLIAESERQCVNARIQGSAADMTKRAMNLIWRDPLMKELGFRMLIPVHDEIIGEAPIDNAIAAAKRLSELMVLAADGLKVPFKCDSILCECWYGEEYDVNDAEDFVNKMSQKYNESKK